MLLRRDVMKLKAKIYRADVPNANNVVYPREELEKAVAEYNKKERFAQGGKYPPELNLNDTPVEKFIGECTLEFDGEYVVATIEALNTKTSIIKDAVSECPDKIKIMPVGQSVLESVSMGVKNMSIMHVVCTCDDVDVGDVEEDMFIAEVIEKDED